MCCVITLRKFIVFVKKDSWRLKNSLFLSVLGMLTNKAPSMVILVMLTVFGLGKYTPLVKRTASGSAVDGAVFDFAQLLAYLVHMRTNRNDIWGLTVLLYSFFGQ